MRTWDAAQVGAAEPFKGRLNVQGRDGTGLKTFIPWVRIHSPELSPSAQNGWYVVYLFEASGEGVHLCISHGSTRFDGRDFVRRSAAEIVPLMTWSRALLGPEAHAAGLVVGINLGSRESLAVAYEASTAFSRRYLQIDLPADEVLAADALRAVQLVGQLYRAQELGQSPESDPPEIVAAESAIARINQPLAERATGQGYGLSTAERRIVELHAMALAEAWLIDNGFTDIKDVSSKQPADFEAKKDGKIYIVEVKGTTSGPDTIMMTRNEVGLHRERCPNNVLIVVSGIELLELRTKAVGGAVAAQVGWAITDEMLTPLAYRCSLEWRQSEI
jgi:hypothetical protein